MSVGMTAHAPSASAADERREVDARLGEVEAQRHLVRIPPRAVGIAWPGMAK